MKEILFLDRLTKKVCVEKIYGESFFKIFYGKGLISAFLRQFALPALAGSSLFSRLYGFFQKCSFSKRKIKPFIQKFEMDSSEFLDPVDSFKSFNDFFIRKLKPEARPIVQGRDVAILPADARYLVYPNLDKVDGFLVKGQKFSLEEFLQEDALARHYAQGSMVIARLCPTDYHRFHFPFNCLPDNPILMPGSLYSVNPLALRKNIHIFSRNKRMMTMLHTKHFGDVLFCEVGATNVGSIHQRFTPLEPYAKGDEKGYFSFGGSSLVLLFEPGSIQFDQDLIDASVDKMEVRGLMGQSMGRALNV
jgi:phosphatidylserine decarboxylase